MPTAFPPDHRLTGVAASAPTSISAALASPEVKAVRHLMVAAGIADISRPITRHELDQKIAASRLETHHAIVLKAALDRAGVIVEDKIAVTAAGNSMPAELRAVLPGLREIGLDGKVMAGRSVTIAEVDQAIAASRLAMPARIALKASLARHGLLRDDEPVHAAAADNDGDEKALASILPHLKQLGIEDHVKNGGSLSAIELDQLIRERGGDPLRDPAPRIVLKNTLDRLGRLRTHRFI